MKCDFCEFEDNVSKLNKNKHPNGWTDVKIDNRYNSLHACPKCARMIMLFTFITKRMAGVSDPETLEPFFPDFKRKDNNDE